MPKLRLGVLGSTKGTDLQAIIDAVKTGELDAEIVLVASDRQDAFILERARIHGIETFVPDYANFPDRWGAEQQIVAKLREKGADLVLLIGFMKILTPNFVQEFKGRIWNIHPSLLPKYAGGINMNVHETVLRNKDKETGCTLHEVTEHVDRGKIIMQKKTPVQAGDTTETLKGKVQKLEQECFLEAIKMVTEGKIVIGGQK